MVAQTELADMRAAWGTVQARQQLLVAAGLRPACRLRINRQELALIAQTTDRLSIKMVVGQQAIVAQEVTGRAGFSEWSRRAALSPSSLGDCYVYICTDHVYGQRLRRCDEAGDDVAVGSLLGYPECCVKAFGERCSTGRSDPVIVMYDDNVPIAWPMNVSLLCFGHSLLSHVPCSPGCRPSHALAERYYDFVQTTEPKGAAELRQVLSGWVLHTDLLGIGAFKAISRNGALEIETISAVDSESILGQLLSIGSFIGRQDTGVIVDGCFLTGGQVRLFEFN
ncbi:MAG: hypothetical protein QOF62_2907 [Pyrinomonadaceae bacterium]|nr:hypothetical protein [Pyrinomonadaceae bacterium]